MATSARVERATCPLGGGCSIQLSYEAIVYWVWRADTDDINKLTLSVKGKLMFLIGYSLVGDLIPYG